MRISETQSFRVASFCGGKTRIAIGPMESAVPGWQTTCGKFSLPIVFIFASPLRSALNGLSVPLYSKLLLTLVSVDERLQLTETPKAQFDCFLGRASNKGQETALSACGDSVERRPPSDQESERSRTGGDNGNIKSRNAQPAEVVEVKLHNSASVIVPDNTNVKTVGEKTFEQYLNERDIRYEFERPLPEKKRPPD